MIFNYGENQRCMGHANISSLDVHLHANDEVLVIGNDQKQFLVNDHNKQSHYMYKNIAHLQNVGVFSTHNPQSDKICYCMQEQLFLTAAAFTSLDRKMNYSLLPPSPHPIPCL